MKWMIASDLHGSAYYCRLLLQRWEEEQADTLLFLGDTQIMTQMGPLPISFEIKAETLAEAVAGYGEAAKQGVRDTIEKLQAMRREAASQIVTPGMPGFQAPPAAGSGIAMP